jgi:hypothetical protein
MNNLMSTQGGYASEAPSMNIMPTLKQRLEQSVKECESRLEDAVRAREILNAHPELEELLNIMQKGRF